MQPFSQLSEAFEKEQSVQWLWVLEIPAKVMCRFNYPHFPNEVTVVETNCRIRCNYAHIFSLPLAVFFIHLIYWELALLMQSIEIDRGLQFLDARFFNYAL